MTIPKLRILLLAFFAALLIPGSVLIVQAYGQLKWEAFHQHQQLAQAVAQRIDANFANIIKREENRTFTDYSFLNVAGSESTAFVQRSPLSVFPLESDIDGLIGYFQVDARGQLLTPTVPDSDSDAASYGISDKELQLRVVLEDEIRTILRRNQLVKKSPVNTSAVASEALLKAEAMAESEVASTQSQGEIAADIVEFDQSAFGQLNSSSRSQSSSLPASNEKVKDLKLDDKYQVAEKAGEILIGSKSPEVKRKARKEKTLLAESLSDLAIAPENDLAILVESDSQLAKTMGLVQAKNELRIRTFETEVESFEFSLLDSGHLVLFRQTWNNNQRYVQGLLLNSDVFLNGLINQAFNDSTLSSMSVLIVAYQGNVIKTFETTGKRDYLSSSSDIARDLLYQTRLIAPFGDMELLFSVSNLPPGTGTIIVSSSALVLLVVLILGFFMLYRLGAKQIALGEQQQNFVSAVSHELKTPLTSIRMYGELLREGWVDEERKKTYYDFIFNESERLSRLINNVLHLARVSRNEQKANRVIKTVGELLDDNLVKIKSQIEPAKFELELKIPDDVKQCLLNIDGDWFTQILINLVDNAIKFSSTVENKTIVISLRKMANQTILFTIRDFGPGIAKDQMRKIFELFYRSENELTRETVGTGIGLALVHQLVKGMDGDIGVVNCNPGAEFKISFPECSRL